ncbi:uncharacterized protein Dark isoform X2 [Venturia canescens]|uniref:uncharacterized protein Dark isoform X2 n=1 Tax=Venturia canescens TaxID=32260 RepID=UPI001C9C578F|nr:uncharacterized protein LOC122414599 isoform X2 [Venturia canescens]
MEKSHRDILRALRSKIIEDLDVHNAILSTLSDEYVLQSEDIKKIESGVTPQQRAQILLDILPSCGPHAFDIFHEALNHHYWWLYKDINKMLGPKNGETMEIIRTPSPGSPNLPPQPSTNIPREAKTAQLKRALQKIEPGGYLVLHGMKGFGKSCLTANTLKDTTLVKTLFTNKVYWIKFGYERLIDDEILIQLNFLYHQVRNTDPLSTNVHSEPLKEQLIHSLKNHFGKPENCNSLLILDDVVSKKIIDVFDFHCKTLVITTDSDLLEGKKREIIEMKDGFTEEESVKLFAKVLQVDVRELPPEAKKIHKECNGMPILIAMFAASFEDFQHDMQVNSERWRYYLDALRKKDPSNRVMEQFLAKQEVIFEICINQLKNDVKNKYEALAIFSEGVNIMPETLSILWGGERFAVEEQMVNLCHKSLAAKHWNADLKSYVYGVHDLLLCYLRKKLGPENLRNLHRSFVEKYRAYCKNDFSKLPNDNYSYSYIGHHMEQAGLHIEFPRLYLDLNFIREKISNTGLSDLLIDLRKYRKLIINDDPKIEEKVVDLENFLESRAGPIAEQRQRKCLDLIQIGMNYTTKKYIYEKTRELANLDSTKLFVTHDGPVFTLSSCDEIRPGAQSAFFTDNPHKILIGNCCGQVILWDCDSRLHNAFSGHTENSPIIKIIVSCNNDYFLTLSQHGHIQHFDLNEDDSDREVQSPREKQQHWKSMFGDKAPRVQGLFSIDKETITDMALSQKDGRLDRIGVCTDKGTIRVWSIDGVIIYTNKEEKHSFVQIAFTRNGAMLHLMDKEGLLMIYVQEIDSKITSYSYVSMWNAKIKRESEVVFLGPVPRTERAMIVVTDSTAVWIKWEESYAGNYANSVIQVHSFMKRAIADVDPRETRFTSATLTYDGKYLITADSKGSVNVWNVKGGWEPLATFNGHVTSLDTYCQGEDNHLICGCGKNVIYRWELALEELRKSVRKPLFDAVMNTVEQENIIAKEVHTSRESQPPTNEVTVNLYHGDSLIAKTKPVQGSIIRLNLNSTGDKILYVTDKRLVMLFDVETKTTTNLLELESTPGIVTFVTTAGSTIVVCGENNDLKIIFGKVEALVEDTGHVTSISTIDNDYVVTIARNGMIKFWCVHETNWTLLSFSQLCTESESVCYSSFNVKKNLLGLLKGNDQMLIYEVTRDDTTNPPIFKTEEYVRFSYNQKLTCCEFSKDDCYLATGLENGDISIFDVNQRCELTRLVLHGNGVRELHWAPISHGAPILLSVNCDELAWWNVALVNEEKKENRLGRMGMSRSTSSLGISPRSSMKLSKSMGAEVSNGIASLSKNPANSVVSSLGKRENGHRNGNIDPKTFWKNKVAKYPNKTALLSLVPLPPSCNSKICVSDDFCQFLSIDIHGVVRNFKFYNYDA